MKLIVNINVKIFAYKLTKGKSKGYILILHCVSHRPLFLLAWLQHHSQNNSYIYWWFSNDNSSDDGIHEITLEKSYHYYNLHVETCNNSSHGGNCQKVLLEHPANGLPGDLVIINLMIIFIIMIMIMMVIMRLWLEVDIKIKCISILVLPSWWWWITQTTDALKSGFLFFLKI